MMIMCVKIVECQSSEGPWIRAYFIRCPPPRATVPHAHAILRALGMAMSVLLSSQYQYFYLLAI